jgi:hypothetical protein
VKIPFRILATVFAAATAIAATNQVTVPGTADVWLAGQSSGTVLQGIFTLSDSAPANSPVLASTGLNLTPGSYLTFSATGSTNYNGCQSSNPDGTIPCGNFTTTAAGPYFGISTYSGPINAVIGVFIGPNAPSGTAPSGLDFSTGSAQSQTTVSPQLNQVFFIGDGLTGTGNGAVQQFIVPAGATRLFLGSSDGAGANYDNSGSITVTVSDTGPASGTPSAPAASAPVLVAIGFLLILVSGYLLSGRPRRA